MFKKSELLVLFCFVLYMIFFPYFLIFILEKKKKGIMFRIQIQFKDMSLERHFSLLSLSKASDMFAGSRFCNL